MKWLFVLGAVLYWYLTPNYKTSKIIEIDIGTVRGKNMYIYLLQDIITRWYQAQNIFIHS